MVEGYIHKIPMVVRFGDLDAMGHLNNAKYATYIEQARIQYMADVCGFGGLWSELGMILARIEIDFKAPILFGDHINIYTRCVRLGGKSFDLDYVITRQPADRSADATVAATSHTVMVAFDYATQKTAPLSDAWRVAMTAYDHPTT